MNELKEIRRRVNKELRSIKPVQDALDGCLDRDVYIRYLSQVAAQYAPHSPIVMSLAASRCLVSHQDLAEYLLRHASEERGHNDWATSDLVTLGVAERTIGSARPVPSCAAMIGYTYYLAGHWNPVALYGWMYVLESVGADLGPDASGSVKKQCKFPVQFIGGHGKADCEHTREMLRVIRRFATEKRDQADILEAADVSAKLYVEMFREIAG